MTDRKYFNHKIIDLEVVYENANGDFAILEELEEELSHRSTQKAKHLLHKVEETLHGEVLTKQGQKEDLSSQETPPAHHPDTAYANGSDEQIDWDAVLSSAADRFVDTDENVSKPLNNRPEDILATWTALEALSPQTYKKPDDLIIGKGSVARLQKGQEPWVQGEKPPPKNKLYYVAYFGAIHLDQATEELLKIYQDKRVERPNVKGIAALGAVVLDQQGIPLPDAGLALSSFGWAYGCALQGGLQHLKYWEAAESALRKGLVDIVYEKDVNGVVQPFSLEKMEMVYQYIIRNCAIPQQNTIPPSFVTRLYQPFNRAEPEAPLLNSFFLDDLQRAKSLVEKDRAGRPLAQYLGIIQPKFQHDLLKDQHHIEEALQPKYTPAGRWPGQGRHSLVLLQQTAVNLAMKELKDGGLFSVNGPPGTGKTTLLRDVVAGVVVERAKAMCAFSNTDDAFTHAGQIKVNSSFIHLYQLDDTLRGHEIVVASVNNKAVENVSKELPQRSQIAEDLQGFSYFKSISNALAGDDFESWGLIAAALGNSANRRPYINKAWWDDDTGLRHYFMSITGQYNPELNDDGEPIIPSIITECDPPANIEEAKKRWTTARASFSETLKKSEDAITQAQFVLEQYRFIENIKPLIKSKYSELKILQQLNVYAEKGRELLQEKCQSTKEQFSQYSEQAKIVNQSKPWLLIRLFFRKRWKAWKKQYLLIEQSLNQCRATQAEQQKELQSLSSEINNRQEKVVNITSDYDTLVRKHNKSEKEIEKYQHICKGRLVTSKLWELTHEEQQKFLPNFVPEIQRLRDDVFVASMELHKAFIDSSVKQFRQNLGAFFYCLAGNQLPEGKQALLPHLWSSHFLLTPVISTAFASVGRMLKDLPPQSVGWLLIDEAGQAPPQAAVGAIYRAKRVMSVGDPLQIEPIVTLPAQLVGTLSKYMGVDPDHWVATDASVQTLSDNANSYGATIPRELSEIKIGSPLLVHRRCENPMFTISNRMAYANLMVHATIPKDSSVTDLFGKQAAWFDVEGHAQEKWCPEEGEQVIHMLEKICAHSPDDPDVFVISPFRVVADKMRQLADKHSHLFTQQGVENTKKSILDNIGTVHTFQGKEARTVILLLGAPSTAQDGARGWATSNVNLLNVAVSRAKQNFYVVGNYKLWADMGYMKLISQHLT